MIHPSTKLVHINNTVGYGLYATAFIPKGTITYVKDPLELEVSPAQMASFEKPLLDAIEKYSYKDERGYMIMSWDMGKYVNHSCDANTMSSGYGFEIAIRDIEIGEQLTDEYGIFNLEEDMICYCGAHNCRKTIQPEDFDNYYAEWDTKLIPALKTIPFVDQPLYYLVENDIKSAIETFLSNNQKYKSVYALRHKHIKTQNAPK